MPAAIPQNALPINSDGQYLGHIVDHAIEVKDTGTIQLAALTLLTHEWNTETKQWDDIVGRDMGVYGYFTLKGRDDKGGKWLDKTVNAVAQLFDWYSGDLKELEEKDLSEVHVQITCKTSTGTDGVDRIGAEWLSIPEAEPRGTGGVRKSDPSKIAALNTQYGGQLRAMTSKLSGQKKPAFVPKQPAKDEIPWG